MKIAVYTIAKNEAQFVQRWFDSARDADYLLILDTGSEDDTCATARALGIHVEERVFNPWRFDNARNAALDLLPDDIDMCIALDMDEVLVDGWRQHLESVSPEVTRPRYKYTWSWLEDGVPGLQYGGDKIHARHGYVWKHPVHEVITPCYGEVQGWCDLEIHHFPDHSKSRGQYFSLLEMAVAEDPDDARNSHYLAREYFFNNMMDKAEAEFIRHLSLPGAVWAPERAQSMRYLYKITGDVEWLRQAVACCPDRREAWVDMAQHYHDRREWDGCLRAAINTLRIKEKPLEYLTEAFAWGSLPHDLAALAAYRLGYFHEAKYHGMEAIRLSPNDERLASNYKFYLEAAV